MGQWSDECSRTVTPSTFSDSFGMRGDPTKGLIHPTALDVAVGWVLSEPTAKPPKFSRFPGPPSPRLALEEVILPALQRPPCVVDFSGGRDSSLVLAVAVHVARREGLPLPIARTRRFIGDSASEESQWQEDLIRHVRLPDWEIIDCGETLDVVGDLAQRFLQRYGVLFPAPMFVVTDSFASARGGSHLTGEGGDENFGLRRAAYARLLLQYPRAMAKRLRTKPQRRDAVNNLLPSFLRRGRFERSHVANLPGKHWLRPAVAHQIGSAIGRRNATDPLDWRDSLAWQLVQPSVQVLFHNLQLVAQDYDVLHVDPLLEPKFVSAWACSGGRFGYPSRPAAMRFVAGDLLPESIIERQDKGSFNTAYFTSTSRRFVQSWGGGGLDSSIVDPEELRKEWSAPTPAANSFMLLQQAWLSANSSRNSSSRRTGCASDETSPR